MDKKSTAVREKGSLAPARKAYIIAVEKCVKLD